MSKFFDKNIDNKKFDMFFELSEYFNERNFHYKNKKYFLVFKEYLESLESIDQLNSEGQTPLHILVEKGDLELFTIFLPFYEKYLFSFDKFGNLPFHSISKDTPIEIISIIFNKIKNIDLVNNHGNSPLINAIIAKNFPLTKFLLEKGANPNFKTKNGYTPLILAASKFTKLEEIKLFLDHGAEIEPYERFESSALQEAFKIGSYDVIQYFIKKGANPLFRNNYGENIIHSSLKSKNLEVIQLAIDVSNDIDGLSFTGGTPLDYVLKDISLLPKDSFLNLFPKDHQILELLILNGAELSTYKDDLPYSFITLKSIKGLYPLKALIYKLFSILFFDKKNINSDYLNAKEYFIKLKSSFYLQYKKNVDLDVIGIDGSTAIEENIKLVKHFALSEIFSLHKRQFIFLDRKDSEGQTLLHQLLNDENSEIYNNHIFTLIEFLADPHIPDNHGVSSFQLAIKKGDSFVLKTFLEKGHNPFYSLSNNSNIELAVESKNEKILNLLHEYITKYNNVCLTDILKIPNLFYFFQQITAYNSNKTDLIEFIDQNNNNTYLHEDSSSCISYNQLPSMFDILKGFLLLSFMAIAFKSFKPYMKSIYNNYFEDYEPDISLIDPSISSDKIKILSTIYEEDEFDEDNEEDEQFYSPNLSEEEKSDVDLSGESW